MAPIPTRNPACSDELIDVVRTRLEARRRALMADPASSARTDDGVDVPWRRMEDAVARMSHEDRVALADVVAAQSRLEDGSWGTCVRCGAPIALDLLLDDPSIPMCGACAHHRRT